MCCASCHIVINANATAVFKAEMQKTSKLALQKTEEVKAFDKRSSVALRRERIRLLSVHQANQDTRTEILNSYNTELEAYVVLLEKFLDLQLASQDKEVSDIPSS